MKGWHRHGVCDERHWPYLDAQQLFVTPLSDWEADAACRPLGAYYRVDRIEFQIRSMRSPAFSV